MATIVISPSNTINFPEGGGHFWAYMQYAQALLRSGCDVHWLEWFRRSGDRTRDELAVSKFLDRMTRYGLSRRVILYADAGPTGGDLRAHEFVNISRYEAETVFGRTDLLLNFNQRIDSALLACFRRTALVDIDPGLLQFWIDVGQLQIPRHDVYFTIGETVGTPQARFSDCGLTWVHIRPPVCLEAWPYAYDANCEAFTTVSSWWGDEWITDRHGSCYENNKRVSFMDFIELPRATRQALELALCLGDEPAKVDTQGRKAPRDFEPRHPFMTDQEHRRLLESHGWTIRHATEVAGTPESYQSYLQCSRGEFSCAKPSCMKFQNAWVSDRTVCYLASGKPAVVQDTGPSAFLPTGEGLFRFSSIEEAADAFLTINASYQRHCQAAREIAETYFDGRKIVETILNSAFSAGPGHDSQEAAGAPAASNSTGQTWSALR
jgi:hypothetical protein